MAREIVVTILDNGDISIEGINLKPGETIEQVAGFITTILATVTEIGHKHTHIVTESNKQIQST